MKVSITCFIGSLIMIASMVFVLHTTADAGYSSMQKKLLAKRAARVDAIRNLTEIIYGTQVNSQTTVEDMVVKSDIIMMRLGTLIKGANEVDYQFHEDGSAEVTMEIELGSVTDILGTTLKYKGKVFTSTGFGTPPTGFGVPSSGRVFSRHVTVAPVQLDGDSGGGNIIRSKGFGVVPDKPGMVKAQKNALAYRAAEVDARRKLLAMALGVKISSDTYVIDMVTESDKIRARVKGCIRGATVIHREESDGIYEVEMEVELAPLITILSKE
ncbi:MAG: hypothetical protein GY941_03380 [Planctomycetes bacterium]|nr:hypothetical protein [Planctomycetota bacterium]